MRLKLFVALLVVLAIAMPLAAQEQRASIEGVVRDTQGGALVGASVTAKAAGGGSREAVTDATGTYRFVSLAPGRYEVTAALSGFATAKVSNIDLRLGQVLTIPMTLAPGGVAETVQVVGESPAHRRQAERPRHEPARGGYRQDAQGPRLHVARNPGSRRRTTRRSWAASRSTARPPRENRFIIDGAETTNLRYGTSGKQLITDFVEEVQVKSSGYAAEYGGATGGVINAITKSGSNTFRGDVMAYFSADSLGIDCGSQGAYCDGRDSLRRNPTDMLQVRVHHLPEGQLDALGPRLQPQRADREGQDVVLRRLPAARRADRPHGHDARRRRRAHPTQKIKQHSSRPTSPASRARRRGTASPTTTRTSSATATCPRSTAPRARSRTSP